MKLSTFNLSNHITDLDLKGNVLMGVMNWGLGHATRCIPIIKQMQESGINPIIASDGAALDLLQKVFPEVKTYTLPSYNVTYAKNPIWFNLKIVSQLPHFYKTIREENQLISSIVEKENISTIISDNRFGVFNNLTKNIFITHQLRIINGIGGWFTSIWHRNIINKFDICWIPDVENEPNLSGKLAHHVSLKIPIRYIGLLSTYQKKVVPIDYDILLLLSGPEPNRTQFEKQLLKRFENTKLHVVMVRGVVEEVVKKSFVNSIEVYNFLHTKQLEEIMNASQKIISRSGYSTLMDLVVLEKEAELHPTPGQPEQIYLAKHYQAILAK